jgi:hypothetical protein
VPVLNPEHLFDQARALIGPPPAGPPRQADLRRAISACYYAIFHATLTAAADLVVGAVHRPTPRYELVYRSISHRWLRELSEGVAKANLPNRIKAYAPQSGFGPDLVAFASAVVEIREKRHSADYDPLFRVVTSEALLALRAAERALDRLRNANSAEREAYLTLLLFQPRKFE